MTILNDTGEKMKSDVLKITKDEASLSALIAETKKAAEYANLGAKEALRLSLLAEELIGMLPELLGYSDGSFWIESEGKKFDLHVSLCPNEFLTADKRKKLISVSSDGKNSAAVGIMAKIKLAAQFMLVDYQLGRARIPPIYADVFKEGDGDSSVVWSLNDYQEKARKKKGEIWDELEKSIISNLADNVLVNLQGDKVEIIVKKEF